MRTSGKIFVLWNNPALMLYRVAPWVEGSYVGSFDQTCSALSINLALSLYPAVLWDEGSDIGSLSIL